MNRAVLVIGGVVGVVALVVAGLLGAAALGGSGGGGDATPSALPVQPLSETPTPAEGDATTPTGAPGASTPTPTGTPTAVPTATPTPTEVPMQTPLPTPTPDPTVPPEEFDRAAIEDRIVDLVNERRERANLTLLDPDGTNSDRLRWMTRNHSEAMAEEGQAVHEIDGEASADRFEEYQLTSRCRWSQESGGLVTPKRNQLEVVGETTVGEPYGGDDRINRNETMAAEAIASAWWGTFYEDRLARRGAEEIGVGVHVHWTGKAYATVALCG